MQTTMTLQEFYQKYNGQRVDFDGSYGAQCWDLFQFYNRDVVGNSTVIRGDAWELYDTCPASFYTKVTTPKFGDVAVWRQSFGGFGHVAIVWDNGQFFSQNYPDIKNHTPSSLQTISTNQLAGYLRPNKFMALPSWVDPNDQKGKLVRIGISPLRYGYVLRGKKHEYISEAEKGIIMNLDKQGITPAFRTDEESWNQIPNSVGLQF